MITDIVNSRIASGLSTLFAHASNTAMSGNLRRRIMEDFLTKVRDFADDQFKPYITIKNLRNGSYARALTHDEVFDIKTDELPLIYLRLRLVAKEDIYEPMFYVETESYTEKEFGKLPRFDNCNEALLYAYKVGLEKEKKDWTYVKRNGQRLNIDDMHDDHILNALSRSSILSSWTARENARKLVYAASERGILPKS